jgi:hypothetical protein
MEHKDLTVSMLEELSDQDLSGQEGGQSGGEWTVPGTYTIGAVCTASWECWGFSCERFVRGR